MNSINLLTILLVCCTIALSGQAFDPNKLHVPIDIQKAYRAGTRSVDGKPGPKHWQNHATYSLEVEVKPVERRLHGKGSILYTNNSPNTLNNIFLTLLYDVTRKGNVRDESIPENRITEGTEFNTLSINGQTLDVTDSDDVLRYGTNMRITLPEALPAGGQLTIELDWEMDLQEEEGRTGFVTETTSFVGYWYPKVSAYDDIDGWDTNSFLGMAEFYSELSDFDVTFTIPESYTLWATGTLQNAREVLPKEQLQRYQKAEKATEPVSIIGEEDREKGITMKSENWHYQADQVPDFAFAFSDDFLWDGISLKTSRGNVRIHSVYPISQKKVGIKTAEWQREAMRYFSEDMPGIPYPYPEFTSFFKPYPAGGMEFPMMANNGCFDNPPGLIGLIAHEMYHMYVPFYIRINEEKYAWMDEGWADFMDARAVQFMMDAEPSNSQRINQKLYLERIIGSQSNVPFITSTAYQNSTNYGYTSYTLPKYVYSLLEEALGEATFKKCLQGYMNRWAYKAPTPYDFFFSFDDLAGQDLSWFWKPWFTEFGYADLGIAAVNPGEIQVVKKGNKPISVDLTLVFEPGDTLRIKESVAIWKEGEEKITVKVADKRIPQRVFLNAWLPDAHQSDNFYLNDKMTTGVDLQEYNGTYALGDGGIAYIRAGDKHLLFESSASGNTYLMLPVGKDQFGTPDGTFDLSFIRDEAGKIVQYQGNRFGNSFTREKLD